MDAIVVYRMVSVALNIYGDTPSGNSRKAKISTTSKIITCFFFFFSSRRRHTRCSRDWSSDVCSSDLLVLRQHGRVDFPLAAGDGARRVAVVPDLVQMH